VNILVTGGCGFIGRNLIEALLKDKHTIYVIDNLSSGSIENIKGLPVHFNQYDIVNPLRVTDYKLYAEIEQIYHLACPASPKYYMANTTATLETATIGTRNMLDLAWRNKASILLASTSEIYGEPTVHPQNEEYFGNVNSFGSRSSYNEGKRCAESLFYNYLHEHNVDIRVARIFNCYGPHMKMDDGRVISNFIVNTIEGNNVTIYGSGSQTRSFCYVSDTVRGLRALMDSNYTAPVNIGNPEELTIKQLLRKVNDLLNKDTMIEHMVSQNDPSKRKPDITKAKVVLGWEPTVSLEEGLQKTIAYFKNLLLKIY
jgi:UDP-glucuronate decarboxylase